MKKKQKPYSYTVFGLQDYTLLSKKIPSLFWSDAKQKDGSSSTGFSSFSNFKNIYITGHSNGAINFWDASSPLLIPIVSFNQQVTSLFRLRYHR